MLGTVIVKKAVPGGGLGFGKSQVGVVRERSGACRDWLGRYPSRPLRAWSRLPPTTACRSSASSLARIGRSRVCGKEIEGDSVSYPYVLGSTMALAVI